MPKTDLTEPAGCYIHIPFCSRKCLYCDFYSVADLTRIPGFLTALLKEIEITPTDELHFDSLYLGGGTPSVLGAEAVHRIIGRALASFSFDQDVEITVEVNPGSVGPDDFEVYRSAGVNRLNIGVQSFDNDRLAFLGRIHTSGQAENCISDARRAGFTNLGIDLIYGIPEQPPQQWQKDLEQALAFSPEHLSCYMLTYEDGTPLHGKMTRGRFQPLGEGPVAELFKLTASFLESRGYEHYEISNFARQDRQSKSPWRSRHNQKYWSLAPYIGLGPSAHSYRHPQRYWNSGRLRDYLQALSEDRLPVEERETLTTQQQMMEMVYLGIRTRDGIDTIRFENTFGISFVQEYGDVVETLVEQGMIRMEPGRCIPTHQGMRFADSIAALLLD
jgi:putative oxygen-independent coproporphyrinogen III oxidase